MLLSSGNGQNTKALEVFSKKFYDGIKDSDRQFRQFLKKKDYINMGQQSGDTFSVSIVGELPLVGVATEGVDAPSSDPSIAKVTVTVHEYASKINYTSKLKAIAELPVEEIFKNTLAKQAARSLDKAAHDLVFATTNLVATATSASALTFTTDGTTAGNTLYDLSLDHVLTISSYFYQNRMPLRDGQIYAIGSAAALEPIKKALTQIAMNTETGFLRFVKGVIGTVYGVVFVQENNVNSKDIYFCGDQPGMEVVVEPEHIVIGAEVDIGRRLELGWRYIGSFSKIQDNRIVRFVGK